MPIAAIALTPPTLLAIDCACCCSMADVLGCMGTGLLMLPLIKADVCGWYAETAMLDILRGFVPGPDTPLGIGRLLGLNWNVIAFPADVIADDVTAGVDEVSFFTKEGFRGGSLIIVEIGLLGSDDEGLVCSVLTDF